jgi:hypothetical protein
LDRITFVDFKRLMKGQPKAKDSSTRGQLLAEKTLEPVPEHHLRNGESLEGDMPEGNLPEAEFIPPHKRSQSFDQTSPLWASTGNMNATSDDASLGSSTSLGRDASRAVLITNFDAEERRASLKTIPLTTPSKESPSPLVLNRVLYRKHREMRISILEASKQFDQKRKTLQASQAGLIMKRGAKAPDAMEDKHAREMFEAAAKRCGRARRSRNKTVSDVTGMMMQVEKKV